MLKLYNTLSRKKEAFKPIKNKRVGLYTCGPTVYWFAHIGNLRTYIFEDLLKRVLEYNDYKVKHVMNITDVGHLTSDEDTGEDKMDKGAKREKKTVWEIAELYTKAFKKDLKFLNIKEPDIWCKATDHIKEQINLIKQLEKKGYIYIIEDGVYFNTSKLKDYGKLTGSKKRKLKAGARVKLVVGKKNITDFALWKFTAKGVKRQMEWNSPWGKGFPGWHIECSAMSMKYLGETFDIHCGGIDHIPIHHTNEIAQSEAASGKPFVKYWVHGEFLVLKKERIGKSKGNIILIDDLRKKEFNPLSYRYLSLTTHYRSKLNFSWKDLKSAQNALDNLYEKVLKIKSKRKPLSKKANLYQKKFLNFINDDLSLPKALALIWDVLKNKTLSNQEKYNLLLDFDNVFGLDLAQIKKLVVPKEIKKLLEERKKYRKENNWKKADEIRKKIKKFGYQVEDTEKGVKIKRI